MFRSTLLLSVVLSVFTSAIVSAGAWARPVVLDQVLRAAAAAKAQGSHPVVVMDLDETVVDSTIRMHQAVQRAISQACGSRRSGDCLNSAGVNLAEVLSLPNRYDEAPAYLRAGVSAAWFARLKEQAIAIYLSGKGMELDQAIPGASEYVTALRRAGVRIYFISSRWERAQRAGTLASLRHLGMLAGAADENHVILRPEGMSSIDFKRRSFEQVLAWARDNRGVVVGAFENEPENMNAMLEIFPQARHVFVEGAWIKDEALKAGAARIRGYR